jgi:type II secretory pathway component GspD/PulD (secretin)
MLALLLIGAGAVSAQQAAEQPSSSTAAMQAQQQHEFEIEGGDLGEALDQFAQQTRLQIIFNPDFLTGKTAPGISGRYTANEVLQQLLNGTGLSWEYVNEKTLTIRPVVARGQGADAATNIALDPTVMAEGAVATDAAVDPGVTLAGESTTASVETVRHHGIEEIIVTGQKREERIQDVRSPSARSRRKT